MYLKTARKILLHQTIYNTLEHDHDIGGNLDGVLVHTLINYFGYPNSRPLQKDIIKWLGWLMVKSMIIVQMVIQAQYFAKTKSIISKVDVDMEPLLNLALTIAEKLFLRAGIHADSAKLKKVDIVIITGLSM